MMKDVADEDVVSYIDNIDVDTNFEKGNRLTAFWGIVWFELFAILLSCSQSPF